jgi:hypothetical protein
MTTLPLSSLDDANGTYYDAVHQNLRVLAAAAEAVDPQVSGALLQAKQKVEEDLLADPALPASYPTDVNALLTATRSALATTGLRSPACR